MRRREFLTALGAAPVARHRRCGRIRCARCKTPNLDRLAERGVRFSYWYSNSQVCSPSRASLFTGQYPQRIGITEVLQSQANFQVKGLAPGTVTLPGELRGKMSGVSAEKAPACQYRLSSRTLEPEPISAALWNGSSGVDRDQVKGMIEFGARSLDTPPALARYLEDHVRTKAEEGWARLQNGAFLEAADGAGFDVLPTTDKT